MGDERLKDSGWVNAQEGGLVAFLMRIISFLLGQGKILFGQGNPGFGQTQASAGLTQAMPEEDRGMETREIPAVLPMLAGLGGAAQATDGWASELKPGVQLNDDWVMKELRLKDSDFVHSLNEAQKNRYVKLRGDVLAEAMKNPEYAPILAEVQERVSKGGRQAEQVLNAMANGAGRREASDSGHYFSALDMQRMEHRMGSEYDAERTGASLPSITRHAGFDKLQKEIEARLKEKIKQDAAFAGIKEPPAFGTEAAVRSYRVYTDKEVSKPLATIMENGYQGKAIQKIFESEAAHVHSVSVIRHGDKYHLTPEDMAEKAGFTQALSDVTLFYVSGYFDSNQRIDWHAKKNGDMLASSQTVSLYLAIGKAAEKLYKDPVFSNLPAQEAARRIMEESIAGMMAEKKEHAQELAMYDAENKKAQFGLREIPREEIAANAKKLADEDIAKTMPLVQQALKSKNLQLALQDAHNKTASALQSHRQHHPDTAREQPTRDHEATSPSGPTWTPPRAHPPAKLPGRTR